MKPSSRLNQSLTDENIFLPRETDNNAADKLAAHAARLQIGDALLRWYAGAAIQRRDASPGHMLAGVDLTEPVRIVASVDVSDRFGAGRWDGGGRGEWFRSGRLCQLLAAEPLAGIVESISPNETARHTLAQPANLPEMADNRVCDCVCVC